MPAREGQATAGTGRMEEVQPRHEADGQTGGILWILLSIHLPVSLQYLPDLNLAGSQLARESGKCVFRDRRSYIMN